MQSNSDKDDYTVHSDCSPGSNNNEFNDSESDANDDSLNVQKYPDRKMCSYECLREQHIARKVRTRLQLMENLVLLRQQLLVHLSREVQCGTTK